MSAYARPRPLINVRKRLHEVRGQWSQHNRWANQPTASEEVRAAHARVVKAIGALVTALEAEITARREQSQPKARDA